MESTFVIKILIVDAREGDVHHIPCHMSKLKSFIILFLKSNVDIMVVSTEIGLKCCSFLIEGMVEYWVHTIKV